jgi:hypothetical protein
MILNPRNHEPVQSIFEFTLRGPLTFYLIAMQATLGNPQAAKTINCL